MVRNARHLDPHDSSALPLFFVTYFSSNIPDWLAAVVPFAVCQVMLKQNIKRNTLLFLLLRSLECSLYFRGFISTLRSYSNSKRTRKKTSLHFVFIGTTHTTPKVSPQTPARTVNYRGRFPSKDRTTDGSAVNS